MFTIEKNVPTPDRGNGRKGTLASTLRSLEVGDSFLYPKLKRGTLGQMFLRCAPAKFVTRADSETEVRVWRVE